MNAIKIIIPVTGIAILINFGWFHYATMSQYFVFCMASVILFAAGTYTLIRAKAHYTFSTIEILFLGWALYIAIYGCLLKTEHYTLFYMLLLYLFFQGTVWLLRSKRLSYKPLPYLFIALATIESAICLLQWAGGVKSCSPLFIITGSWESPNVTAMFIALTVPFQIQEILSSRRKAAWTGILIMNLFILLLLQCRTAYVGVIITFLLFVSNSSGIKKHITAIRKRYIVTMSIAVFIVSGLGAYGLYQMKRNSADGRVFIWKLSTKLIQEKPLKGYGYGLFERTYNLKQAEYFQKEKASPAETQNARHVFMCYNDFLEQSIEGGVISGIFYLLLLIVAATTAIRLKNYYLLAVIINIIWMSSCNFTIQNVPLMFILLLVLAQLATDSSSHAEKKHTTGNLIAIFAGGIMWLVCCYVQSRNCILQYRLKQAIELAPKQPQTALLLLDSYEDIAGTSECFWRYYGKLLLRNKEYQQAEKALQSATEYTSYPGVYRDLARCYRMLGEYEKEKECLDIIHNMIPSQTQKKKEH